MTATREYSPSDTGTGTATHLPLALIHPSSINPRADFPADYIGELAASIRQVGLLQPLVVRRSDDGDGYDIIAGECRYRACKEAGLASVPVVERHCSREEAEELALVENLRRRDLNAIEVAEGYRRLQARGLTQGQIAERVGSSQPAVANALRLLKLPEDVRGLIREGKLTAGHGAVVLQIAADFPELGSAIAAVAAEKGWSVAQTGGALSDYQRRAELEKLKLFKEIGWDDRFADSCRQNCPFGAYREGGARGLCLRPKHLNELRREQKKTVQEAAATVVERTRATDDASLPQISEMRYDEYERLSADGFADGPHCPADCEHRGRAVSYGGEPIPICTNRKLFQEHYAAHRAALTAATGAIAEAELATVRARLDALTSLDQAGPELQFLLGKVDGNEVRHRKTVTKRTGIDLKACSPVERLRHTMECLCLCDVEAAKGGGWYAPGALKAFKDVAPPEPVTPVEAPNEDAIARVQHLEMELVAARDVARNAAYEERCRWWDTLAPAFGGDIGLAEQVGGFGNAEPAEFAACVRKLVAIIHELRGGPVAEPAPVARSIDARCPLCGAEDLGACECDEDKVNAALAARKGAGNA